MMTHALCGGHLTARPTRDGVRLTCGRCQRGLTVRREPTTPSEPQKPGWVSFTVPRAWIEESEAATRAAYAAVRAATR